MKDRLYTYPIKFKPGKLPLRPGLPSQQELYLARRSAQTAIYKITDALARLTAPILSFTADEVYQSLPHTPDHASVHLTLFPTPEDLASVNTKGIEIDFEFLLQIRSGVLQELEKSRSEKVIGKSLEATVLLELSAVPFRVLKKYESSLCELFNVSYVEMRCSEDTEA